MPSTKAQITTKDLEVINELLLFEELAYKKCSTYANLYSDKELTNCCKTLAKNHKSRFNAIYDYLTQV